MELAENQLKNARKERQDVENHTVLTILHFKKILDGNRYGKSKFSAKICLAELIVQLGSTQKAKKSVKI